MKKNILIKVLYIFCILLFASCSNDDENTTAPTTNQTLIKKITETIYYSGASDTYVQNYEYENSILKSISDGIHKMQFVYSGEKIIKANYLTNGVIDGFTSFYYDGDFLSYTLSGKNQKERTNYSYQNGILASETYGYDDGNAFVVQQSAVYSYNPDNNISHTITTSNFFGTITSKQNYFYDNKNNPMKYMNKYLRLVISFEGFDGKTANNIISRESFSPITSTVPDYYSYEIVYNSDNFPTEIKKFDKSNNYLISITTIEYQ